jgi:signal transduction histidine kinase
VDLFGFPYDDRVPAILGRVRTAFGLTERSLRYIGIFGWLVAGSTSFVRFARNSEGVVPWAVAYLGFGALFWISSDRSASYAIRLGSLAGQAVLAAVLAFLGMPLFEGALLALVAAQVPTLLPLWMSLPWAAVQAIPLGIALGRIYDRVETTKSITGYLGFSAFAIFAVHLFEAERKAKLDLDRTVRELVATRAMLEQSTRIAERMHIARELHDLLGHDLSAFVLQLDLARRTAEEKTRPALDQIHKSAHQMLQNVRNTVIQIEKKTDLSLLVRKMVEKFPGLHVDVDMPPELSIDDDVRSLVAWRCVQESVTNVVKYARAERVGIMLRELNGNLDVRIEDDGRGIGEAKPGFGLRNMRERIEALGGTLEISNGPSGGTVVFARIPLGEIEP